MHALGLSGIDGLEKLDVYIKDDVERYGTKLEDCHRRLKRFLAELLRPVLQEGEDGTNIFDEQNESFVSGDFTDELDEDFFGFRELGLDKELGLISLSVSWILNFLLTKRFHYDCCKGECELQSTLQQMEAKFPRTKTSLNLRIGNQLLRNQ